MMILSPSLLSVDFGHIADGIEMIDKAGAQYVHLDVMDGAFVPNISFGAPVIKGIRNTTDRVFDVHLMIEEPARYLNDFKDAGADIVTVHAESCRHLHSTIMQIKALGMKAGVALNPATPVSVLDYILQDIDMVLVMSVNPGFGGQKFIEHSVEKVKELRELIERTGSKALIEVDGGVNLETGARLIAAGADALVAGNAIFAAENPEGMIHAMKGL